MNTILSKRASMILFGFSALVLSLVGGAAVIPVEAFTAPAGVARASRRFVTVVKPNVLIQHQTAPGQPHKILRHRGDTKDSSGLSARNDWRSCWTASTSHLFLSQSSDDSQKNGKVQNIRVLGRLSLSGLLAYGYMQYFAVVTFGSCAYYLFQKTAGKRGFKNGEWVMLGGILIGLTVLKNFLGPAKFALELVVTSFFSYLFITLAQGDI